MAGREKFTIAQVIQAIRDTKGLLSLAAQRLGCDWQTARNYTLRHAEVAAALKEERDAMTDVAELALFNCIQKGEAWAVCFYLKCQGKERGYVERHEIEHTVVEREAKRLADEFGLDAGEVLREAEATVKRAT